MNYQHCSGRRSGQRLLADIRSGQQVRIFAIEGGHKLRSRLAAMGLFPGVEVKIIKDDPFVIAVHGSRLVLGRGIACKISVY